MNRLMDLVFCLWGICLAYISQDIGEDLVSYILVFATGVAFDNVLNPRR